MFSATSHASPQLDIKSHSYLPTSNCYKSLDMRPLQKNQDRLTPQQMFEKRNFIEARAPSTCSLENSPLRIEEDGLATMANNKLDVLPKE